MKHTASPAPSRWTAFDEPYGVAQNGHAERVQLPLGEPGQDPQLPIPEQRRRDGVITNDKFCWVRRTRLQLSWSRLALRSRSVAGSAGAEKSLGQGGMDATRMDRTPDDAAGPGRTAPLGSGVPGSAGLDKRWTRRRSARRRGSGTSSAGGTA